MSIARIAGVSENLVHKSLAVADLPEDAREWIRKNPKVNDATIYAAAAKFRREGGGDFVAMAKAVSLDVAEFEQRLSAKAKLQEAVIQKILAVL